MIHSKIHWIDNPCNCKFNFPYDFCISQLRYKWWRHKAFKSNLVLLRNKKPVGLTVFKRIRAIDENQLKVFKSQWNLIEIFNWITRLYPRLTTDVENQCNKMTNKSQLQIEVEHFNNSNNSFEHHSFWAENWTHETVSFLTETFRFFNNNWAN